MSQVPILIMGFIFAFFLPVAAADSSFCYASAGQRYHIAPDLLRAIGLVESHENSLSQGVNRDSRGRVVSRDFGLMQINDRHLAELRRLGIVDSSNELLSRPCLNIQIGAWILARHLRLCGNTWQCLGSYNAGFSRKNKVRRQQYAQRVYKVWRNLRSQAVAR
ncbi:lytic transglycosylase [Erwinia sp. Ejp617]|nr:lytic transglycosylase [Erwinia sp. Ejp617]